MAFGKSTTSDDVEHQGATRLQQMKQQHEALTREIYGCPLDELLTIAIKRGFSQGHSEGWAAGYNRGRTDGRRAAKGTKKSSKITAKVVVAIAAGRFGRRANHKLFMQTAIDVLSSLSAGVAELSNQEMPKDVTTFLKWPRPGNWPSGWPKPKTLQSAYSRAFRQNEFRDISLSSSSTSRFGNLKKSNSS